MSWSGFVWHPNIPQMFARLTTPGLHYDNESMPAQSELRCNTDVMCSGPCCVAPHANLCTAVAPEIMVFADGVFGAGTTYVAPSCCCNPPPCTCDSFYYTCGIHNLRQVCGALNGRVTLTLGQNGYGDVQNTGARGTDWDISIPQDYTGKDGNWAYLGQQHTGWINAVYSYDFSNYNIGNAPNGPFPLSQWISDVCTGTNKASAPNGMDASAVPRIRDSTIVYAIVLDCFNQMYNDGYYSTNPDSRQYMQNYDFFQFGFRTYINKIIFSLVGYLEGLFPSGVIPDLFVTSLTQILQPPLAKQLPSNVYQVSLQLSFPQYQNYQQASDKAGFINAFLASLLRDTEASMGNRTVSGTWAPDNPVLANPTLDWVTAIQLPGYIVTSGIDPTDWNTNWASKYPTYFFATAQVTGTVTKWSPLLAIYFQIFGGATFDSATCQAIANPPQSLHSATIPIPCYQSDCVDPGQCKSDIQKFCPITYTPPPYTSRNTTDKYLVSNNYPDCYCYTSALAPISNPEPGNIGAMCFDKYCGPKFRQQFDLDDARCKGYCSTVYGWLTGTGADQSQNANHMDWQRFQQICGKEYRPYTPANWNVGILVSGTIATLFTSFITYAMTQHKNYSSSKTKITVGIVSVLLLLITLFFSRDFAGLSGCDYDKNKFECTTRITKMKVPKQFCNYVLNCECAFDNNCPSGCLCASGSCQPQTGKRAFTIKHTRNIPMLIISIVLAILFSIGLYSLHEESHWKVRLPLFMAGVIGLSLIPIGYFALKTFPEQVFAEGCKAGGACQADTDCSSGSTCVQGQCEALAPGCPVAGKAAPPSDALQSGAYIIQTKDRYMYLYPQANNPVYVSTNGDSRAQCHNKLPQAWTFDAANKLLTSVDPGGVTCCMIAYDVCQNTGCQGSVYCQDVTRASPQPKFLLGASGTIYSFEAQAYLVPASNQPCQTVPCFAGNCFNTLCEIYVTYTTDLQTAAAWLFTPCDPATTCKTSCGTCPPFSTCTLDTRKCLPMARSMYFYENPTFSDPKPWQIIMYSTTAVWYPAPSADPPTPGTGTWLYDPITRIFFSNNVSCLCELGFNAATGAVIGVSQGFGAKWRIGEDNLIYLDTPDNYFIGQDGEGSTPVVLSYASPTVTRRYVKFFS